MLTSGNDKNVVLIRGGGDLASGVALRLHRIGFRVVISELPQPLVVRRMASFAQAVFDNRCRVEEVEGVRVNSAPDALQEMDSGKVAVIIDPAAEVRRQLPLRAMVDGRMTKNPPDLGLDAAYFVIGLGPGFEAGKNCDAVVETNRGPFLGRVYWEGKAEEDNGIPESVKGYNVQRVLYAPKNGILKAYKRIGETCEEGESIAEVSGETIKAPFWGVLRGLIQEGLHVRQGLKIGDLDPRGDVRLCFLASEKALAIGGGVTEAILNRRR